MKLMADGGWLLIGAVCFVIVMIADSGIPKQVREQKPLGDALKANLGRRTPR